MLSAIPYDPLMQLLQHTFGAQVRLVRWNVSNQQQDYLVLLVQLSHPSAKIVVKLAGPGAKMAGSFDRTAELHQLVSAHTSIPMPEILAVNVSYQDWPWRYLIKTYIPGHLWARIRNHMPPAELSNAYRQIGTAVAQLHAIHYPTFGAINAQDSAQGDKPYLSALVEHARNIIPQARVRDLYCSMLDKQAHLFLDVRQACLCHEDLHGWNILFQHRLGKWQLATILDFDKAWAGHHETDLARLEFWRGMTADEFWQSYQASVPIDPLYTQRRPLYQLLWCFEYDRNTPEHLANTQHLCDQFGLPFPGKFD